MKRMILAAMWGVVLSASIALAQGTLQTEGPRWKGEKISLDFQDAQVRQVIQLIADVSGRNVVISDAVSGTVTLKLKKVPWDQALDLVLKTGGLGMEVQGDIIRIDTLENLARQRDEATRAQQGIVSSEALVTRMVETHYADPEQLASVISAGKGSEAGGILSSRGTVTVAAMTKTLIIKDIESNIDLVLNMIRQLDRATEQVTIEARIVQVIPSYARDLGIEWSADSTIYQSNSLLRPEAAVSLPSRAAGAMGISFGRLIGSPLALDMRLSAYEEQGLSKIISSPKITVLDNQEAEIKSGNQIPYAVVSDAGASTILKDAVLSLKVTPKVTGDGRVTLDIEVKKDQPAPVGNVTGIETRQAKTSVLVADGDTTVIGGIYERTQSESGVRVPFLSRLPLIGFMFQSKSVKEDVKELLIFITPRIGE